HGTVERYQPTTGTVLTPWRVGNSLRGIDLTPDGSALLVADELRGATAGFIRRVDTNTGAVTNLTYPRNGLEGGAWDLAILKNGKALFTTAVDGSGASPVRAIDIATNVVGDAGTSLSSGSNGGSLVSRSAARSVALFG